MTNASKNKGDQHEREAVRALVDLFPDLAVWNAQRLLGAGRKEDVGDLLVLEDTAIQVKAYKQSGLSAGIYSAAAGATVQAANARKPFALGIVLVPRARLVGAVRWIAAVDEWPVARVHEIASSSIAAFTEVKAAGPAARVTVQVLRKNTPPIVLGSLQTWAEDYRTAVGKPRSPIEGDDAA